MAWKKVPDAAREWAGDVNPKIVYAAIRDGKCKAARIGAGRNMLVCEEFIQEWLQGVSLKEKREPRKRGPGQVSPHHRHGRDAGR